MYEEDRIRYLGPELCTKRILEVKGLERDPAWIPDSSGVIRVKLHTSDPKAALDSQFALKYPWTRRGLALEVGDVMTYEIHEMLIDKLVVALTRDPLPERRRSARRITIWVFRGRWTREIQEESREREHPHTPCV